MAGAVFAFMLYEHSCHLGVEPVELRLRSAFGTSHSLTSTRTNAIVTVHIGPHSGAAEVGLPPKKPGCYEADMNNMVSFAVRFQSTLTRVTSTDWRTGAHLVPDALPLTVVSGDARIDLLAALRTFAPGELPSAIIPAIAFLRAVDAATAPPAPAYARACGSGIEVAVLDMLARAVNVPLWRWLWAAAAAPSAPPPPTPLRHSFYTCALNPDTNAMVATAEFGHHFTPYLKIKLSDDLPFARVALDEVVGRLRRLWAAAATPDAAAPRKLLSVDANAAWTPTLALEFAELLRPLSDLILMVEQPFPVDLLARVAADPAEADAWRAVREAYGAMGVLVYADESMRTAADVAALAPFVHGVNIKIEKTGGYREALRCILAARQAGLHVWLGVMVGGTLNSTATAQLLPLAEHGDLDGSLLVQEGSDPFQGGFQWGTLGDVLADGAPVTPLSPAHGSVRLADAPGLGVALRPPRDDTR